MQDILYWIWLQCALGYGSGRIGALLDEYGHAREVYNARQANSLDRLLKPGELARLRKTSLEQAEPIYESCQKIGCEPLSPDSGDYPEKLRNIYAMPCVLYVLGDLSGMDDALCIGMVGKRQCSEYGMHAALYLSRALAGAGAVIVSGLAAGIDTQCHHGALKAKGRTVAVLGCGVDVPYPPANERLQKLLASEGAVVSEYPPGTRPFGEYFPARNRIISGLSDGVVVVQADRRSGALITAGHALSQGRDVFAVPSDIFDTECEGNIHLIKQGAKVVTEPMDVIEEYTHLYPALAQARLLLQRPVYHKKRESTPKPAPEAKPRAKREAPAYLNERQAAVYALIGEAPENAQQLSEQSQVPVHELLAVLTELEIYGLIQNGPGGYRI